MVNEERLAWIRAQLDDLSKTPWLGQFTESELKSFERAVKRAKDIVDEERDRNNRGLPSRQYADMPD
jgi:hypothetical protein